MTGWVHLCKRVVELLHTLLLASGQSDTSINVCCVCEHSATDVTLIRLCEKGFTGPAGRLTSRKTKERKTFSAAKHFLISVRPTYEPPSLASAPAQWRWASPSCRSVWRWSWGRREGRSGGGKAHFYWDESTFVLASRGFLPALRISCWGDFDHRCIRRKIPWTEQVTPYLRAWGKTCIPIWMSCNVSAIVSAKLSRYRPVKGLESPEFLGNKSSKLAKMKCFAANGDFLKKKQLFFDMFQRRSS